MRERVRCSFRAQTRQASFLPWMLATETDGPNGEAMKTKNRELEPLVSIESGDKIQRIIERHLMTADCETISAILQIHPESLPCAAYVLLHSKDHLGESAVPGLCPSALRELVELLLAVGLEAGLRLGGDGSPTWRN
jgi:hypothetical protein